MGHHHHHSIIDPSEYYWGEPTSNIDWCENNYVQSPYIAEFYNSVTSAIISAYALYGIYLLTRMHNSYHHNLMAKEGFIGRLNIAYFSLFLVGAGSVAFHATLLYQNQLFDELPMIYTSLILLYILMTVGETKNANGTYKGGFLGNSLLRHILPYLLVVYGLFITVTIIVIKDQPKILQISYGALVIYIVLHSAFLIEKRDSESISTQRSPDNYLYRYAFCAFLAGYALWVTERFFCQDGYVIVGLQLHAIWHILTGLGVFVWTQFLICKLLEAKGYKIQLQHFLGIPNVVAIGKK
ncbi:hypothetical protein CYY_006938 [Polysphondylium violaceum]|uniref:Alkaline dihydroceramidase n=1 Tax=Polysphondylium violaceum TaxID=133409 RepID=A0A8J4PQH7_9MYCE|nr:hypothetical protein CYY_006938 [Polysphondylium violaceum]